MLDKQQESVAGEVGSRGEKEKVKNAVANIAKASEETKDIIRCETSRHLKVKYIAIGNAAVVAHEESFIEQRSFVVRDRPTHRERSLDEKQRGKEREEGFSCDTHEIMIRHTCTGMQAQVLRAC